MKKDCELCKHSYRNTGIICTTEPCLSEDGLPNFEPIKKESGLKYDEGKNRWDLVPFKYLDELVKVYTEGAKDHGDNRWQDISSERWFAALMRHITAWRNGQKIDPQYGLHHLAHAMWNCIALMYKDDECIMSKKDGVPTFSIDMSDMEQRVLASRRRSGKSSIGTMYPQIHTDYMCRSQVIPIEPIKLKEDEVKRFVNGEWMIMKKDIEPKFLIGTEIISKKTGNIAIVLRLDREKQVYHIQYVDKPTIVVFRQEFSKLHENFVKVECNKCKYVDKRLRDRPCNTCFTGDHFSYKKFKLKKELRK